MIKDDVEYENGEKAEAFVHPQIFFRSLYYQYFSAAYESKIHSDEDLLFDFFVLGDGFFGESYDDIYQDLINRIELASSVGLRECNWLVERIESVYGGKPVESYWKLDAWNDLYKEELDGCVKNLCRHIKKQVSLFPQMSEICGYISSLINAEEKKSFLERNKGYIVNVAKSVVNGYMLNPIGVWNAVRDSMKSDLSDAYNQYKALSARFVENALEAMDASVEFEKKLSNLTMKLLKNENYFKDFYL
jgi:hypothetical protein